MLLIGAVMKLPEADAPSSRSKQPRWMDKRPYRYGVAICVVSVALASPTKDQLWRIWPQNLDIGLFVGGIMLIGVPLLLPTALMVIYYKLGKS